MARIIPKKHFMKISQGFYSTEKLYKMLKSENREWLSRLSERLVHQDMYVYNYDDAYCLDYYEPQGCSEFFCSSIGEL